ncbi:aluminum-activated malate transporter 6-like [Durio zibethinus]|uniref:Aluminum-activated malate transporter 6-like n=1 Tax=Durio zibethinus TaxID=66656 RepID=A0A6P6A7W5_DURZI|nr:aluminum-activated malate transporter 6-like [Durio zibethinus]
MNGKKGSVEINIPPAPKVKQPEVGKNSGFQGFSCKAWIWNFWEFCREDSNRVTFSFKVGLAVLLVSLLILLRGPYEIFGTDIIWSILTVAIMFEYTVGMYVHIVMQHNHDFMFIGHNIVHKPTP